MKSLSRSPIEWFRNQFPTGSGTSSLPVVPQVVIGTTWNHWNHWNRPHRLEPLVEPLGGINRAGNGVVAGGDFGGGPRQAHMGIHTRVRRVLRPRQQALASPFLGRAS